MFKAQQEAVGRTEWPRKASHGSGGRVVRDKAGSCLQRVNADERTGCGIELGKVMME